MLLLCLYYISQARKTITKENMKNHKNIKVLKSQHKIMKARAHASGMKLEKVVEQVIEKGLEK